MTTVGAVAGTTPGPDATQPHGTSAAIRRHQRLGEQLCEECRIERNRLAKVYYDKRRGNG